MRWLNYRVIISIHEFGRWLNLTKCWIMEMSDHRGLY